MPRGGPDGGDGGDGGDVIVLVDPDLRTLLHLRHETVFEAQRGGHGQGKTRFGRRGTDCHIRIPVGTAIRDAETGAWIADCTKPGDAVIVARGGRGGKGNVHFKSSTRRTPRIATPGGQGETRELLLELRLLADVGIVGLPNVGKSTLLARVSNARPRIGDFPFTTLEPNLGIVAVGDYFSFVMADIPGLVEGAHRGKGLGTRFLKHIERTRLLLFLLDSASTSPERDLQILRSELESFSPALAHRPRLVAFSRADLGPSAAIAATPAAALDGAEPIRFSAHTGEGIDLLLARLREGLLVTPSEPVEAVAPAAIDESSDPFAIRLDRGDELGERPWPRRWFVGIMEEEESRRASDG